MPGIPGEVGSSGQEEMDGRREGVAGETILPLPTAGFGEPLVFPFSFLKAQCIVHPSLATLY